MEKTQHASPSSNDSSTMPFAQHATEDRIPHSRLVTRWRLRLWFTKNCAKLRLRAREKNENVFFKGTVTQCQCNVQGTQESNMKAPCANVKKKDCTFRRSPPMRRSRSACSWLVLNRGSASLRVTPATCTRGTQIGCACQDANAIDVPSCDVLLRKAHISQLRATTVCPKLPPWQ